MTDDTDEWPCYCGGDHPEWEYHCENACGDASQYLSWAAKPDPIGERFPELGGE